MKSTILVYTLLFVATLTCRFARADDLHSALKAALDENADSVKLTDPRFALFNHTFGVTPVRMITSAKKGGPHELHGELTHYGPSGATNLVAYRINKAGGAIKSISVRTNQGAWEDISSAVFHALGGWRDGVPMPDDAQHEVDVALRRAGEGTWKQAAEFLIAHIAIRHC